MMGFSTFFTISFLALASFSLSLNAKLFAQDASTQVLDLNQVDMEQVDDNWENQSQVPKLNPGSGLKIKDIVEPTSDYTYASFGKPDPFAVPSFAKPVTSTLTETAEEAAIGSKEITVISPLQAYPLNVLLVKGVWQTAEGEFRAVIQTPKKEGVVVKIGDPISSGKILGIEKDNILVRLYKLRKDGVREYEDSRMTFGNGTLVTKETIKLVPGKEAQFPGMDEPADDTASKASAPASPQAAGAGAAGTLPPPPPGFINPDLKKPAAGAAPAKEATAGTATAPAPAGTTAPPATPASSPASSSRPGATN